MLELRPCSFICLLHLRVLRPQQLLAWPRQRLILHVDHLVVQPLLLPLEGQSGLFLLPLAPLSLQHGLLLAYLVVGVPPSETVKKGVSVLA